MKTQDSRQQNRSLIDIQWINKWKKFLPVLLCTTGLLLASCGGDGNSTGPEPDPDPDPDPNPNRAVSFSEDIEPIFTGTCATSSCHDSGTQQSGVNLSSYEDALDSEGNQYGENIINPGNPDESPIIDKISNDDPQFGDRMPKDRPALSQADIDSIRAWIEDDAPNN